MSYFLSPAVSDNPRTKAEPSPVSFKSQASKHEKVRIGRSSSLGDWWRRNLNPSLKPERGGTIREHRFWDEPTDGPSRTTQKPLRRVTGSQQGRQSETTDSDRITLWNTAIDILESHDRPASSHRRAVPVAVKPSSPDASDRKWSWIPRDDSQRQSLPKTSGSQGDLKVSWQDLQLEDNLEFEPSPTQAVRRRLSDARRSIEAKKEARRQRRNLKESGDYLGVQGINPETGQLDVITPSNSDNSAVRRDKERKITAFKQALREDGNIYKGTKMDTEKEVKLFLLKEEKKGMEKRQRDKEAMDLVSNGLRWRRHTKQWSSAQEPNLTPIAQSQRRGIPISSK